MDQIDQIVGMMLLGKLGQPTDVAHVVAFLAPDAACWIMGQNIQASGGIPYLRGTSIEGQNDGVAGF